MHNCPCCDEITYMSANRDELCDDCQTAGCLASRAADGDWNYWNCDRDDVYDDEYPLDDTYDRFYPGPDEMGPDPLDVPSYAS